jgi:hypothetical protein
MKPTKQKAIGLVTVLALLAGLGVFALRAQDFDRFKSGGYLNGLGWLAMDSEQRSTFLLGFHDGARAGISVALAHAHSKEDPDKVLAEILVHDNPGLDVEGGIGRIYKDDANLRIPISLVYQVVKQEFTPEGERVALDQLRKDIKR